jgi:Fur family ferric uptake transcriptional regulator
MTRQRRVILEELRKVNTHPSADEIYEIVRKRLPRISLGTVYRNLEILSESGDIQKLEPGCSYPLCLLRSNC